MLISLESWEREATLLRRFDGVDPTALADAELADFVSAAAAARHAAEVVLALASAEVERRDRQRAGASGYSRSRGEPTSRRTIARATGGTEGEAQKLIDVGMALGNAAAREDDAGGGAADRHGAPAWPLVAGAVENGRLSKDKAAAILSALEAIGDRGGDGLEAELVEKGVALTLRLLHRAIDAAMAMLDRDALAATQAEQHRARALRVWESRDGMTRLAGELDPVTAAPVRAFLEAYVQQSLSARRDTPEPWRDSRSTAQMNADALGTMARHVLGCSEPIVKATAMVVVRTTLDELGRSDGLGESDQLHTPLSGDALGVLSCGARIVRMVMDAASQPLDVGYAKPFFTQAQRVALLERDGGCAFCHAPASWGEAHHIIERARGGRTDLENGAMLCTACHHRLHRDHWGLEVRGTEIWVIPPSTVDPARTPFLGGRAALRLRGAPGEPLPQNASPPDPESPGESSAQAA